jgi:hypothetical protein
VTTFFREETALTSFSEALDRIRSSASEEKRAIGINSQPDNHMADCQ